MMRSNEKFVLLLGPSSHTEGVRQVGRELETRAGQANINSTWGLIKKEWMGLLHLRLRLER